MRKNLNKLATLALSGMMVMSMAVPAMAAQNFDQPVINKVLYTDGHTYAPNTEFTFDVTHDSSVTSFQNGTSTVTLSTPKDTAKNSAVTVNPIRFNPAEDQLGIRLDNDGNVFRKSGAINVNLDKFPGEGYYLFNLKEHKGTYEGIRYDEHDYKLLVIIYKDEADHDTLKSKVVVSRVGANNTSVKTSSIGNNYGRETPPPETPENPPVTPPETPENPPITPDNPDNDTHDVLIKKVVKGAMSNKSMTFDFEIKIESDKKGDKKGHEYYEVTGENVAAGTFIESDVTDAKVFHVKDGGEGIRIWGLTDGDKITVKEANGTGYTMLVKTETPSLITGLTGVDQDVTASYTTVFNAVHDDAKVTVTNKKDAITPTGIVMNVAPYAMMLAVAGGLGVVFMNRKKEEE